jgi:hypothetical protein
MKLTESKLRRIIREEIISESAGLTAEEALRRLGIEPHDKPHGTYEIGTSEGPLWLQNQDGGVRMSLPNGGHAMFYDGQLLMRVLRALNIQMNPTR